jgi:hypothetical protein
VTENPTPDDASEEAISATDFVEYVVNQVKKNPKAYAIGGAVVAFLVVKKFRGGKDVVELGEKLTTPADVRLFAGPYGTDTYDLSVLLRGAEIRRAVENVVPAAAKK